MDLRKDSAFGKRRDSLPKVTLGFPVQTAVLQPLGGSPLLVEVLVERHSDKYEGDAYRETGLQDLRTAFMSR